MSIAARQSIGAGVAELTLAANNGDIGGGEVMLLAMADIARSIGLDVHIVGPEGSDVIGRADNARFPTTGIPGSGRRQYIGNLRRWDHRERTGLLWCHGLVPALATAGHRRRVVELHQFPTGPQAVASRLAATGDTRVVVPSDFMCSRLPGSTTLANWTEELHVAPHVHEAPEPLVIGFMGRLSPDKGVVVLAQALRLLDQRQPGMFRLLLAGEPRFVSEDAVRRVEEELATVAHLTDRRGWIERSEFFSSIDLAVFPSVWDEPFGLVVAEAMSARVPFIVSDAGALPEVAGHGYPWIARRNDPIALADVIERMAATEHTEGVETARRRWEDHYSPDAAAKRLRSLFTELDLVREDKTS